LEYNKLANVPGHNPRDIKMKQREGDIYPRETIKELVAEISSLKAQLSEIQPNTDTSNLFTAEQVDEMINKAVVESVEEALNSSAGYIPPTGELEKLKEELRLKDAIIETLEKQNMGLEHSNSTMDEDIQELKKMVTETTKKLETLMILQHEGSEFYDPDRPQMEDVFIDPSKEEKFEAHIDVKEVSEQEKVSYTEKMNKLKGLGISFGAQE
jgi:prefoldin subunit 5